MRRADLAPGRAAESLAILAIGASRRTVRAAPAWSTKPAQAQASSAAALTSSLKRSVRRRLLRWLTLPLSGDLHSCVSQIAVFGHRTKSASVRLPTMPARSMHEDDPLEDFDHREITLEGVAKVVHTAGDGPAVIVMTEMPGISPHVARFKAVTAGR